jgi:hypothetical protein
MNPVAIALACCAAGQVAMPHAARVLRQEKAAALALVVAEQA